MPVLLIFVLFFAFFTPQPVLQAQEPGVITVCPADCTHTDLQAALNAAPPGSRILLQAGRTYTGNFILPYKGESGDSIVIESTEMDKLPPPGIRVRAEDAEFMPKLVPADRTAPVLRSGSEEQFVAQVNPSNDTIVYSEPHKYEENAGISFWGDGEAPEGMELYRTYYVRRVSATAVRLAASVDGQPIDIRTAYTGRTLRSNSAEPGNRYVLRGIEFTVARNAVQEYGLVEIGTSTASSRESISSQIELDRVYIHGLLNQNGPRICLMINARQFTVANSRIEHCNKEGEEGKGIVLILAPGPGLIRNNYVEGGSINLLMGGDYVRIPNLISGDEGGIEIFGNHFYKPMRLKYTAGNGGETDPSGRCGNGWYLNVTSGRWFQCNGDNSWVPGPSCARGEYFRRGNVPQTCENGACWECSAEGRFVPATTLRASGYFVKNLFEIKSGANLYVHGNVFENNWSNSDQSGVGIWVISQVAQGNANGWVRGENILFTNNIVRNSAQGIRIASEGGTVFNTPNRNVRVVNNLLYDIGATSIPSIATNDARPISLAGECVDCQFLNNTVVSGVSGGTGVYVDTKPLTNFRFANNIFSGNRYGFLGDRGLPLSFYLPGSQSIQNNVMLVDAPESARFAPGNNRIIGPSVSLFANKEARDFRLNPDSPFSAGCTQRCEYTADNARNVGADIDRIEQDTSGAVAGTPNWDEEFGLRIESVEPTKAVLSYYLRTEESCSIRVSTHPSLRAPIPNIDAGAPDGNGAADAQRKVQIGTNEPLQPGTSYYFKLTCGKRHQTGEFKTLPAP